MIDRDAAAPDPRPPTSASSPPTRRAAPGPPGLAAARTPGAARPCDRTPQRTAVAAGTAPLADAPARGELRPLPARSPAPPGGAVLPDRRLQRTRLRPARRR